MSQVYLQSLSDRNVIPFNHTQFLIKLKNTYNFEPKVVYDIGACVLHWTKNAKQLWPDAEYVLFDAFAPASFLYDGYKHHVGVLSDADDKIVKFYQNDTDPGGNSYYREVGHQLSSRVFPDDSCTSCSTRSLDSVIAERNFPLPDLIKIDVQGAEKDIIAGGIKAMAHAKVLIVEMQDSLYNQGAPMAHETLPYIESLGWTCIAHKFCDNGPDADYAFVRNGSGIL